MAGEKTEKATHKRKQDERKKGNIFTSKEITTVASILVVFFSLKLLLPINFNWLSDMMKKYFLIGSSHPEVNIASMRNIGAEIIWMYIKCALPILLIAILVNVIITAGQTRMLFSAKAFEFKGDRINPLSGFKKMFSLKSIVELLKSITKIILLITIIYFVLRNKVAIIPKLMEIELLPAVSYTASLIINVVTYVGIFFAFLAAADYIYQWWDYEKNLRMTKQEIKDEYKQMEGDPQIKSQIRALQQQRARQRMMQSVPEADVIIRNPTHFAVAIRYTPGEDVAPVVLAKGAGVIALRIIEIGQENFVYITEDKPLARALYKSVDVGMPIPEEFYKPIAEILTFIYKINK